MECERLKRLIKNWYMQVQDEAMAPARMVDFMRKHIADCATCLGDPIVELEVRRITEMVLPLSKVPKAVRKEEEDERDEDDTEDVDEETEEEDTDEVDDDDIDDEEDDEDEDEDDEI